MHKPGRPEVPEMGGLGIVTGFIIGVLLAIALETFLSDRYDVDSVILLAVLATVLITALIGILDDLFEMSQGVKALLPLLAALPLMAVYSGPTYITIPLLGRMEFGVLYALIVLPIGITGAANAVNMLAGFNGLEVGMGMIAMAALAVIAATIGATTSLILLLAGLGTLGATLYYNWYPAKILIGDVGTLSIGAIIAAAVIVGKFQTAGVIIIIPYFFDFVMKAINGFPSRGWWGELQGDKLYCPTSRPVSLCQLIMKLFGGIRERDLVLTLIGVEAVFGLIAVLMYARF